MLPFAEVVEDGAEDEVDDALADPCPEVTEEQLVAQLQRARWTLCAPNKAIPLSTLGLAGGW